MVIDKLFLDYFFNIFSSPLVIRNHCVPEDFFAGHRFLTFIFDERLLTRGRLSV